MESIYDPIIVKTRFMLDSYKKYRKNFEVKKELLLSQTFSWREEKELLLQTIDEKDFFVFLEKLQPIIEKNHKLSD